ncbi:hypothetical protein ACFQMA_18910 [Halosimplex aquaticum]|uniref:DUF4352 domain-containing protein n=1 Tax=Halosimplex aquaticum TaxID=3026162 RepID=A0ABD5Y395_9EURY|nr:hypothetical protein [Halosimplex aquaticum]
MNRRAFLATAAAVTAGCGQTERTTDSPSGDDGPATETRSSGGGPATDSPTRTETATVAPASVGVTDVSVPSTIEIGTAGTLSVTLENAGGQSGSFSSAVEAKVGTGEWTATDATVEATVAAGESVTETVDLPPNHYVEPASYRLADADPVARTRFVAREIPLGETHLLPNGVALSVHDVGFGETYTYESSGGEKTAEPTDGDKWAVGTVRAENTADEPARAPLVSDIGFFRGEEEYSFQHLSDNRDRYRGGELEPGSVSEGDLPANVPVAAERAALRVEYSESFEEGQITVNWTLGE